MKQQDIRLHIENLVLHGIPVADRAAVGVAVQQELTRLLSERGLPSSLSSSVTVDRFHAGSISFQADASAGSVGLQIARSVYGGLQ